jgi:hypothetical protein
MEDEEFGYEKLIVWQRFLGWAIVFCRLLKGLKPIGNIIG